MRYKDCDIHDVEAFYKEKFAHNHTYDIYNEKNYEYNILNLKQMYIFDYIKPNSLVLDFGCGSGIFKILKEIDCTIVGVDMSKQALKYAKDLNSYDEVHSLDIFDKFYDKYKHSFDFIISSDVFGHIEFQEKDRVIQRLKELLKPNGTMIHGIETGDIDYKNMSKKQRYDFVSIDGHVGMESDKKTAQRFQKFFKNVNIYTPYGIVNDLDEIIKQNESYEVSHIDKKLISYLKSKRESREFKDAFNISQFCAHKHYEANIPKNTYLNLYGFSFLVCSNKEIVKYQTKKPKPKPKPQAKKPQKSLKIAIVAPSPLPFGVGGAEKLWWGMLEHINKKTQNQCELIKIPTKEDSFWSLIDSYYKFYTLDLSHFDIVISTKYPAWMTQHQNHHIYLQHCLRGLYDTYNLNTPLPSHPKIKPIIDLLKDETTTIDRLFNSLFKLKQDSTIPDTLFSFPGAFIREIVHFLDNRAMQTIKSFSAISQTVIDRKEYFPKDAIVQKLYHPSNLTSFENSSYDYFFTASRLDGAKRVDVIIKAYMNSNTTIPLKIAGSGPLEHELKELSKDDSRIEFLGFISDEELVQHYSRAYAVLFVPYDEDYGLITIEAAMSEKPILTFSDSGGVTEFVKDRITGLVCTPSTSKLTSNIDFIASNPKLCKTMGKEAKKAVTSITWEETIQRLLSSAKPRDKITVVTTYPIYPPRGGGQNRVFYLYKELAKSMTVEVICLVENGQKYRRAQVAPNLFEIRVPKSLSHEAKEQAMQAKVNIPITDIAMLYICDETPLFKEAIQTSYKTSKQLIATQPYTYHICKSITSNPIIHDSQNVEYILKKQMLKDTPNSQKLLNRLYKVEREACKDSLFTAVCTFDDAKSMQELYQFDIKKAVVVPNGVDLDTVPYISAEQREQIQNQYNLQEEKIVLFIGSYHQPNIDAVKEIFNIAVKLPLHKFIVLGGVANYFVSSTKPDNVGFAGVVTDKEKEIYLSIASVAINPMLTGSGTNLKMLDYMANGIPVVSTHVGARGLNIPDGYIVKCNLEEFPSYIENIDCYTDILKSRTFVEDSFSWKTIAGNFKQLLLSNFR